MVTLLDFVHKCRARWGGGAEPARRPDGLGRFFFTGVAEEHWDVYPHLDEITGIICELLALVVNMWIVAMVSSHESSVREELRYFA